MYGFHLQVASDRKGRDAEQKKDGNRFKNALEATLGIFFCLVGLRFVGRRR
jgi:hypothetical protein